ncbi:MAG TPA: DUF4203 domain-containing protein [Vicinamibacterales bacterium]|jgi:hypothetical protein|nr:DUF4203 domain-containing protein [Vicinamibacterales bacterium]
MLPAAYQMPAAVGLLLAGVIACFFGYRLFRVVLALSGFFIGALLASSVFGASSTGPMLIAALVGGLIGAAIMFTAYFVGVAISGAVLGALIATLWFSTGNQGPHFLVIVIAAAIGAAAAMYLQRYFIIVATGFGGAWTIIVGAMALLGDKRALSAAATGDVWVVYPLNPAPGRGWVTYAWVALGLIGITVQLGWTGGEKGRVGKRSRKK